MDFNQENSLAYKTEFMDFLDQDLGHGLYMEKIRSMVGEGRRRLLVDLNDLRSFRPDLARRVLLSPSEYLQPFADALEDATRNINPKYIHEGEEVHIGFEGQFGFHKVNPRELLSTFLGHMVCVEGIVTKCSLVRPKVVKSVHFCPTTSEFMNREYRDITATSGLPTGAVYPTRDDQGNLLVTEFGLCKYRDHQTLCIQEMPENSAPGQLPRSVDVIAEDDLVDACKPGDRVAVVGVYKAIPGKSKGTVSGVFRTVLVANNVAQLNKEIVMPIFTAEDISNITMIGSRPDAFDLLGESLAPSICGHSWIKKAVVLQLLSGMEKNLKNGTHIRGDINLMMVGDPSVAKSQLLRAVMNIAPLAISTTGRGSSGVGLTAAVTTDQETGDRRLEAGAMVLADRGVVCIDEFDKMSDLDRVAIHEVMEQQTVTIAKAGIHASLNARCSVIAAANPIYGSYDNTITPTKNIGLPDSLLSRFDLLFIVLDQMDADIDRHIAEHVLRMHRYRMPGDDGGIPITAAAHGAEEEEVETGTAVVFVKYNRLLHGEKRTRHTRRETLTIKFLKKYIHYAKSRFTPKLTEEASEQIAQAYTEMRQATVENRSTGGGTLPITPRTLETMIRLSTAHAKLKLQKEVTKNDVDSGLKLMYFAIYHKELSDMEERREKERETESNRKRQAGSSGDGRDENGHDDDDDDDGRGDSRRQGSRRRRRTDDGESGQGTGVQEAAPQPDLEPVQQNGHAAARTGSENGAIEETHSAGIMAIPPVAVSAERESVFTKAFASYLIASRASALEFDQILEQVNQRSSDPFTAGEVIFILRAMQDQNQIFISDDTVHIV